MSPQVILDDIPDSSDILEHFINATETRNRVDASVMMRTVKLLTDIVEAHHRMRLDVNMDFVDPGTSWTKALSKLFSSLNEMIQGHIDDSFGLLLTLHEVYMEHVDYTVTTMSTAVQECDSLIADIHYMAGKAELRQSVDEIETEKIKQLRLKLRNLYSMMDNYDSMLEAEVDKSSYGRQYFPNPLNIDGCRLLLRMLLLDTSRQEYVLLAFLQRVPRMTAVPYDVINQIFLDVTDFRTKMANMTRCLLSYHNQLTVFEKELVDFRSAKRSTDFEYEIPYSSLRKFNADDELLATVSSLYIASSLSKFKLATALRANGSEILTNANRLFTNIDTSLFSKASDLINSWEKSMTSFYMGLVKQVNTIQLYMFPDDKRPENFLRRISIWRMPIVNFQKSQVLLLFCYVKLI